MGLLSLYTPRAPGGSGQPGDHSGNPDDGRPKPIGGPKKEGHKRRHVWTPGGVRDFVGNLQRGEYGYFSSKKAAAIAEVVEGGAGADKQYNKIEVGDTAGAILEDHTALGLTEKEARKLARRFEEGPQA